MVDMEAVTEGDTVEVHIKNNCALGGDTQVARFEATQVHVDKIVGVDPSWGDECVVENIGTDEVHYSDGGKSGKVVRWEKR